ncbi:MAG: tetraacyldisaccharide 4'-kinase [Bacteroidetes bacterium]|nr:tetraacyldisaccharide 4'-kinase [Bacteroidota bacterium]
MKLLRILVFPISLLYGVIVFFRNKLYDWRLLSSTEFTIPTISVGNLSIGGTGKTPHIEYLVRLLKPEFYIATLSRGYGRKTRGFILSDTQSSVADIGDEPLQYKKKFNGLRVAVDESRVRGIKKLLENFPSLQAVLLDDAFQHRAIKSGLSIVLTDYSKTYLKDYMMPSGALREFRCGIQRADIIIVSKCPEILLAIERKRLINAINPLPYQNLYFSYIKYGDFIPLYTNNNPFTKEYYIEHNYSALLLTGIANTRNLEHYLKEKLKQIVPAKFPDHHQFTKSDLGKVKELFNTITSQNKIILCTEKDAMRLQTPELKTILDTLPVFYMRIEVCFHDKDKDARLNEGVGQEFNEKILHYVRANQKNSSIHTK